MTNPIYICYENNSSGVNIIEPELRFGKKNFATQVISIAVATLLRGDYNGKFSNRKHYQ
ncbi:MAG: hypothetical protein GWN01_02900 [Nitrosopumilaceae archaeon]|nr:hypothetical protein [Nitrosopumilaceae archaeon]NIX60517.1 hypothetical protein [Nitrosopumilaceae archaeon]